MTTPILNDANYDRLAEYFPDFAPYLTAQTPKKCVKRIGKHNEGVLYQLLQMAKQDKEHWALDSNARSLVRSAYLFLKKKDPDLNRFCGELKRYITQTGLAVGPLSDRKSDFLVGQMRIWNNNCKQKIKIVSREKSKNDPELQRLKDSRKVISEMLSQLYLKNKGFLVAVDASNAVQGVAQVNIGRNVRELFLIATNPNNLSPLETAYDGARKVNGVGSSLIAYISRISKNSSNELQLSSYKSARRFYEHLGFERCSPLGRITQYRLPFEQENQLRKNYGYRFSSIPDVSPVS